MGNNNNNVSTKDIRDIYRQVISEFRSQGKGTELLENRLRKLEVKELEKDKLGLARTYLWDVIKNVESHQDKYGIPADLYYSIKKFLDE